MRGFLSHIFDAGDAECVPRFMVKVVRFGDSEFVARLAMRGIGGRHSEWRPRVTVPFSLFQSWDGLMRAGGFGTPRGE